jgi:hypothetical protein
MKNEEIKPPVYFFQDENKAKKKPFLLIKTGTKSYAMSFKNLLSSLKEETHTKGVGCKKKD